MRLAWIDERLTMARSAGPGSSVPAISIIRRATIWVRRRVAVTFWARVASRRSPSGLSGSQASRMRLALTRTSMPSLASRVAATRLVIASFSRRSPAKAWTRPG